MKPRNILRSTKGLITLALAASLGTAFAQQQPRPGAPANTTGSPGAVMLVTKSQHGIAYLNGGVGKDERAAMQAMNKEFNLHLTFSERKDGELVSGVKLSIVDTKGKTVFDLADAGPLLWVKLPAGTYRVHAIFQGHAEDRSVALSDKAPVQAYFHWKGSPNPG